MAFDVRQPRPRSDPGSRISGAAPPFCQSIFSKQKEPTLRFLFTTAARVREGKAALTYQFNSADVHDVAEERVKRVILAPLDR